MTDPIETLNKGGALTERLVLIEHEGITPMILTHPGNRRVNVAAVIDVAIMVTVVQYVP